MNERLKKDKERQKGFTLIEILVATFILVIIALIMAKLFHQCSVAWSAGNRKAAGNMTGRAAVGLMARELMGAVAEPDYLDDVDMRDGQKSIQFITLTGDTAAGERAARRIKYEIDGTTIVRKEARCSLSTYGSFGSDLTPAAILVTNVPADGLLFTMPSDCTAGSPDLPKYVSIAIKCNRSEDVSGVSAWSWGYDRSNNTPDDIRSW